MADELKYRVALFNPIIAHYRAGLVRELSASRLCEFYWHADAIDKSHGIPIVDLEGDASYRQTRCLSLGRLKWQLGTIGAAFENYDTYIFLGSADWLSSWAGAAIARLRGKRVLFWTHGWIKSQESWTKRLIRNSLYRLAHGLLLYGERARDIGISQGFEPAELHVMYNSLDFDAQQSMERVVDESASIQVRLNLFGEHQTPVVIATARLTPVKRFDMLIRALGALRRSGKAINLLLVGDGPQRKYLEQLAADESVPVAFVGACYDEQSLARYFLAANVTVSPGNVGLTCMHSLGYGVPVITHDNADDQMPEWEAIIPGVNGWLYKYNDTDSLAHAIDLSTQTSVLPSETRTHCIESLLAKYHPTIQAQRIVSAAIGGRLRTGSQAAVAQSQ